MLDRNAQILLFDDLSFSDDFLMFNSKLNQKALCCSIVKVVEGKRGQTRCTSRGQSAISEVSLIVLAFFAACNMESRNVHKFVSLFSKSLEVRSIPLRDQLDRNLPLEAARSVTPTKPVSHKT
jgi:hypothetical protein